MSLSELEPAPAPAEPTVLNGGTVTLNRRFEIDLGGPLPAFDTATARAFAARDRRDDGAEVVCHVCVTVLPPRTDILGPIRGLENPALMMVRDFGVVTWPDGSAQYPVVIYDRPPGRPLMRRLDERLQPYGDEALIHQAISPFTLALKELKARRVFDGQINPTNIYVGAAPGQPLVLGAFAIAPPGYCQPLLFETIERGMADPPGRGIGNTGDDLYALGVVLLILALGRNPLAGLSDQQILMQKLERGSYAALVKDSRISGQIIEPIRGLLLDEPSQRWTLDDLELWLNGRRLSPKQPQPAKRAQRPLVFDGGEHFTTRSLAFALHRRPKQADALIDSGELDTWLRRSMENEVLAEKVQEAVNGVPAGSAAADRKLARVLMALDPPAPIRYRGVAVMPEGIGTALIDGLVRPGRTQELGELISAQLPSFWIYVQSAFSAEFVAVVKAFETARSLVDRMSYGYGIERCLYHLNPAMPCRSPILEGYYIQELDRLLYALDEIAERLDRPAVPYDRHIVAFILSRDSGISDRGLTDLGTTSSECDRALATLDLFFDVQRKCRAFPLPRLARWLVQLMEPTIARYHSKSLRDRVREELDRQAETGAFKNIFAIVANRNLVGRDDKAYDIALREYRLAGQVVLHRQRELENRAAFVEGIGRQSAAVVASLLSAMLLAVIVLAGLG